MGVMDREPWTAIKDTLARFKGAANKTQRALASAAIDLAGIRDVRVICYA